MTQVYLEKENTIASNRSRTYGQFTSSDAIPPSYRRLVGAKAIKLGSYDKHPVYCYKDFIGLECGREMVCTIIPSVFKKTLVFINGYPF